MNKKATISRRDEYGKTEGTLRFPKKKNVHTRQERNDVPIRIKIRKRLMK
jgi:hypothetical protein